MDPVKMPKSACCGEAWPFFYSCISSFRKRWSVCAGNVQTEIHPESEPCRPCYRNRRHSKLKRFTWWKSVCYHYLADVVITRIYLLLTCQWLLLSWIMPVMDAAVFTSDPRYRLWPNPTRIPYQIEINNINSQDFNSLMAAMAQISSDTAQCIQFIPYDANIDRGADFVLFRNRLTTGIIDICYTFPGLVTNNGFGQVAVVFGSNSWPGNNATGASIPGIGSGTTIGQPNLPGACLDSQRDTMRVLMNILGIRNEHNRNDRSSYLAFQSADPNTLVTSTLQKYNIFTPYANNSVATIASTFDYNSVTLVTGQQYAASPNAPVFVPLGTNIIGQLPRLSRTDCLLMNLLYSCSSPCPDPYTSSGTVIFGTPRTFLKHVYCPPLTASSFLTTPLVIGDVTITNAPGVAFRYTISPQAGYLSVISTTKSFPGRPDLPAGRIVLTQIPSKGFVNGQFTVTAISTSGGLQGTTTVTLTVNCVPNFVSSYGGRPTFTQPSNIGQPTTFATPNQPPDVFSITIGSNESPGIYVNCYNEDLPSNAAVYLPSCVGFVQAADPEGGRVSYYVTSPFPDANFNRDYSVTQDGVICFGDNNGLLPGNPPDIFPYASPITRTEDIYVAAVDPIGGISVIHYRIFIQCAPIG
ncbi:uncharacterized protein LOC129594158 [Paramacrobiotus metropolitanus]|uniref:uncharacterized protein LOC129594158 n=1 Tax=Paramacrobiotus metropolitanus TaxID=2943436 RepID=UPI0024462B1B|nr:uncharacterized protein LOC129594158 [Paramacrobiotus metropolitanus]